MIENTKIKLDLKDKKILTLLDEDSRLSNSQIAKKIQLSKPAVEYRIQRLQKNNIIFSYYTVIDITKLGYSQYKIYFKFQNASIEDEQKIVDYWKKDRNSVWLAQIRGRWDLAVSILAKTNFEFGKVLSEFIGKFSKFILEKDVLLTEYSPVYSRRYLTDSKAKEFVYAKPIKSIELDEIDEKILKELAENARINIVDLAEKLKITRDIINYRIKKLTNQGIIVQYRCYLNLHKIGINHYKIILRTKNFDEKAEKSIKDYVSHHKKATQFLKLIGSWDVEIEFETENEDELYSILTDIRKQFSDIIRDFDIIRITQTYKYNYFPF
ncbi:MAG: winged helix-turn-helix transcriptional regulator [Candidatus Pacearchaeota archaeon]